MIWKVCCKFGRKFLGNLYRKSDGDCKEDCRASHASCFSINRVWCQLKLNEKSLEAGYSCCCQANKNNSRENKDGKLQIANDSIHKMAIFWSKYHKIVVEKAIFSWFSVKKNSTNYINDE